LHLGDCVEVTKRLPDESVDLSVFSPPFPGMYTYSNSVRDIGNAKGIDDLMAHFAFLAPELLRVTKPGRSAFVHLTQYVAHINSDGFAGLKDFRGRTIEMMQEAGWRYYGEITIDKNPQVKAIRTKDRRPAVQDARDRFEHDARRLARLGTSLPQGRREPEPD